MSFDPRWRLSCIASAALPAWWDDPTFPSSHGAAAHLPFAAIRRLATDYNVPLVTNLQVAEYFIKAIENERAGNPIQEVSMQEYWEMDGNN